MSNANPVPQSIPTIGTSSSVTSSSMNSNGAENVLKMHCDFFAKQPGVISVKQMYSPNTNQTVIVLRMSQSPAQQHQPYQSLDFSCYNKYAIFVHHAIQDSSTGIFLYGNPAMQCVFDPIQYQMQRLTMDVKLVEQCIHQISGIIDKPRKKNLTIQKQKTKKSKAGSTTSTSATTSDGSQPVVTVDPITGQTIIMDDATSSSSLSSSTNGSNTGTGGGSAGSSGGKKPKLTKVSQVSFL
jgi:hypothetical protein